MTYRDINTMLRIIRKITYISLAITTSNAKDFNSDSNGNRIYDWDTVPVI